MDFSVKASISPSAAAKLVISGEIDLSGSWLETAAIRVINEIVAMPIDEVLQIVDGHHYGQIADVKLIPQFGKIEIVLQVPDYFCEKGLSCADYPQMGYFLKRDIHASLDANIKFGENYGKAAAILGVAQCVDCRFLPSALSSAFCDLSKSEREALLCKLLFRIPIVQIILCSAANGEFNGYAPMNQLMKSTRQRRGQCLRAIFKTLYAFGDPILNARIENIVWNDR